MPAQTLCAALSGGRKIMFARMLYTARRARPLARRALITALPPLVFMRTRNPWVRFLLVTEGWYVRFILMPLNG
jgi:hypothetical protein